MKKKNKEEILEINIEDLKKAFTEMKNNDLSSFIRKYFNTVDSKEDIAKIYNNIPKLKKLDTNILTLGISRMNTMIEGQRSLEIVPIIITLLGSLLVIYEKLLVKSFGEDVSIVLMILLISFITITFMKNMLLDQKNMIMAVYFRTLLEDAKKEKERYLEKKENELEQIKIIKQKQEEIEQKQEQIEQRLLWIKTESRK